MLLAPRAIDRRAAYIDGRTKSSLFSLPCLFHPAAAAASFRENHSSSSANLPPIAHRPSRTAPHRTAPRTTISSSWKYVAADV
jgi:hypothetical protein